jgi:hypothetical protein
MKGSGCVSEEGQGALLSELIGSGPAVKPAAA